MLQVCIAAVTVRCSARMENTAAMLGAVNNCFMRQDAPWCSFLLVFGFLSVAGFPQHDRHCCAGWEGVMRVRCSKGLSISQFHGHFFVRSIDLLSLPQVRRLKMLHHAECKANSSSVWTLLQFAATMSLRSSHPEAVLQAVCWPQSTHQPNSSCTFPALAYTTGHSSIWLHPTGRILHICLCPAIFCITSIPRHQTLDCLLQVDPDKAFAVQIKHEESVLTGNIAYMQCAVLFSSSNGERRIRYVACNHSSFPQKRCHDWCQAA